MYRLISLSKRVLLQLECVEITNSEYLRKKNRKKRVTRSASLANRRRAVHHRAGFSLFSRPLRFLRDWLHFSKSTRARRIIIASISGEFRKSNGKGRGNASREPVANYSRTPVVYYCQRAIEAARRPMGK